MKRRRKHTHPIFDAEGYQTNIKDLNGTPLPDLSKVRVKPLRDGARFDTEPTFAFWDNPADAIYDQPKRKPKPAS